MKNKYKINGEETIVYIDSQYGMYEVVIDTEDLSKINKFKTTWNIQFRDGKVESVRTKTQKNKIRKLHLMHRVINDCPEELVVDHIDGNPLNNRKSNLRNVTSLENMTNLKVETDSITGYRGVYFEASISRYRVRFKKNGKNHSFGSYKTLKEAKEIADKARRELFPLSR